MIVWKVTLQDFLSQEDIEPYCVETDEEDLCQVDHAIRISLPFVKNRRVRVVERVGTIGRCSTGFPQLLHESIGQGY